MRSDDEEATRLLDMAQRAAEMGQETHARKDGWIVTLSTALLASPVVIGGQLATLGNKGWWVLAAGEACFAWAVVLTIVRQFVVTKSLWAGTRQLAYAVLVLPGYASPDEKAKAVTETESANKWRKGYSRVEDVLDIIGLCFFSLGVFAIAVLALMKSNPSVSSTVHATSAETSPAAPAPKPLPSPGP